MIFMAGGKEYFMKRLALLGIVFVLFASGCVSRGSNDTVVPFSVNENRCCQECVNDGGNRGSADCLQVLNETGITSGECVRIFKEVATYTVDDCKGIVNEANGVGNTSDYIADDAVRTDEDVMNQSLL
ncbi:Uncharacterised protein [uncultured archaeon]|nr:Uncharacterised protein [uncultured archaeon]